MHSSHMHFELFLHYFICPQGFNTELGHAITLDQEKAFDDIDHQYQCHDLKCYDFGKKFISVSCLNE